MRHSFPVSVRWSAVLPIAASLGLGLRAQTDVAATDWDATVRKACEHRRYALRRAAAGKIAKGGADAVAAVRRYADAHPSGANALPLELVSAIAMANTARSEELEALLEQWAKNRDFYWRAQAATGLARREIPRLEAWFRECLTDPSHLMRIAAAKGLWLLDPRGDGRTPATRLSSADPDPRTRLRLAAFRFQQGDPTAAPILVASYSATDEFLGDPWASRLTMEARRALAKGLGVKMAEVPAPGADNEAIDQLRTKIRSAFPQLTEWREPMHDAILADEWIGGVEIRSCRNGDLFVRWSSEGRVAIGLDPVRLAEVSPADWAKVQAAVRALPEERAVRGRVVCDFLQWVGVRPQRRMKFAPGALAQTADAALKALAQALDNAKEATVADAIRARLPQFARTESTGKRK